jgi:glycosyltransferase involved in cell wall biosynthesis
LKILLVSQMYPGPDDPDLGTFVAQVERALADRGHEIERAVLDSRSGGKRRHFRLSAKTARVARRFRPDVVYAHFLVPTGLTAAVATRAPLVVTAHGRDVRNIGAYPGIRAATRFVARRASALIAVSDYLRRELELKIPEARGKTHVVDCGVDLELFTPAEHHTVSDTVPVSDTGNLNGDSPVFVCVGSLTERKNVVRLAEAFERLGRGRLVFVGDGPLRDRLEGRPGVEVVGRVPHGQVAGYIAAADVLCQPSTIEPFGQALLEAMAMERSVVATRVGGPPEFVSPDAGVLVDPLDTADLADGLRRAAELPVPNRAARAAAAEHDLRRQAERIEAILDTAARDRRA